MLSNQPDVAQVADPPKKTAGATKLVRAAALAAMLVLVGVLPARASGIIPCFGIDESGCSGLALYLAGGGYQSYTWQFFDVDTMVYSFTLAGTPAASFFVDVTDPWTTPQNVPTTWGNLTCVSSVEAECLVFTATGYMAYEGDGQPYPGPQTSPTWVNGYTVAVLWEAGDVIAPPYLATILKHENAGPWDFTNAVALTDIRYAPYLAPPDPGISGKGSGFSTFGVFQGPGLPAPTVVFTKEELLYGPTAVPEPASMILLGTGLAGMAFRARRRKQ